MNLINLFSYLDFICLFLKLDKNECKTKQKFTIKALILFSDDNEYNDR